MLASTIGTSLSICPCRSTEHKKRLYFSLKNLECLSQIEHIYVHTTCWGLCYVCLDMQRSQIAFNFRTACRQIVSLCILNYSWSWRRNLCGSRTSPWVSGQLYADLKMVLVTSPVCIKNIFSSLHVRTYQQTLTFHRIYRRCIWRMHDWISHLISSLFLNYHRSSSRNKVRTQDIFFIEQWIYPKKILCT